MVCAKCEKKLAKSSSNSMACVDMWKSGGAERSGGRKVGENKLLSSKSRYSPYAPGGSKAGGSGAGKTGDASGSVGKCLTCRTTVARAGAKYCQAYKGGVCALCGKQVLDTKQYKMSSK
ncbi:hypothetical protein JCM10207_007801 [Rhodosporidiobolus poonsookiae]